jgi:hypothetical protein
MFYYKAFGLNIRSELALPELAPGAEGPEDILIRRGEFAMPPLELTTIQRGGIEALFGVSPGRAYLQWPGMAGMLAEDGRTLTVFPAYGDIPPRLLNQFILSEALGMVLFQRGSFLLHASAVDIGGRAIVLAGLPGAGKSTTAAALLQRGHPVLSDDMVALDLKHAEVMAQAGFDNMKISPATAVALGYEPNDLPEVFPHSVKRLLKQQGEFSTSPLPLKSIYILEAGERLAFRRLTGMNAFLPLLQFFPCPSALLKDSPATYLRQCEEVCRRVPIVRVLSPRNLDLLGDLANGLTS